jgi:Icc-related predicted phosphoesterase
MFSSLDEELMEPKVEFQIVSDLHIEVDVSDSLDPLSFITPTANTLILAGDIGSLYRFRQLRNFFDCLCTHFITVVYVPGNHEYYRRDNILPLKFSVLNKRLKSLGSRINNLYVCEKSWVNVGNVCIVGATLWSRATVPIPKYLVRIKGMSDAKYKSEFENAVRYIEQMATYCMTEGLRLMVVTHYPPTLSVLKEARKRKRFESLYASDLEHLLLVDKIPTWVCGHVHNNFDFISVGGTRVVSNQKGKPKDRITDYSKTFIIKL